MDLLFAYKENKIDFSKKEQRICFGTSGHRGSSIKNSFNELHVLSISKAIVDFRKTFNLDAMYIGIDTHMLSFSAFKTAIRVFATYDIKMICQKNFIVPTPIISRMIVKHNKINKNKVDGIIFTPSHNPPEDGGYKYNFINGGPSSLEITKEIEQRANIILEKFIKNPNFKLLSLEESLKRIEYKDIIQEYVNDLDQMIDFDIIKSKDLLIKIDPLGGSSIETWQKINKTYNLNFIIDDKVDPEFKFIEKDKNNIIKMDCSNENTVKSLINETKDNFILGLANDPDADRHGIVYKGKLIPAQEYLILMINYLLENRSWKNQENNNKTIKIGKTIVTSCILDLIANKNNIEVLETPVGFKFFTEPLWNEEAIFCGEESAGSSFLTKNKETWTTDKDGIISCLLAVEMLARNNSYLDLNKLNINQISDHYFEKIDIIINFEQKNKIHQIDLKECFVKYLNENFDQDLENFLIAGERLLNIENKINDFNIDGIKIILPSGWIVIRMSGTEEIVKIYTESLKSLEHQKQMIDFAKGFLYNII